MAHYVCITYMVSGTLRDSLYGSGDTSWLIIWFGDTSWLIIWFAGHFVTHYMVLGTLRDLLYGSGTLRDLLYGSGTLRDSLYGSRDTLWLIIWFWGHFVTYYMARGHFVTYYMVRGHFVTYYMVRGHFVTHYMVRGTNKKWGNSNMGSDVGSVYNESRITKTNWTHPRFNLLPSNY